MKDKIEKMYTQALIDDLAPNVFAEQIMSEFWTKLSEKKPNSYKTGHWDGKMSDEILFADSNGLFYVGKCYQGVMDGTEFCLFYNHFDFEVDSNVTHWAEIPEILTLNP